MDAPRSSKKKISIADIQKILDESDHDSDLSPDVSDFETSQETDDSDEECYYDDDDEDEDDYDDDDDEATSAPPPSSPFPSTSAARAGDATKWYDVTGKYTKKFSFTGLSGLKNIPLSVSSAIDVFLLYVNKEVMNLIIDCTNIAATNHYLSKNKQWKNLTEEELKRFLALLLYFGLVNYPTIKRYWSKERKFLNLFVRGIMARNRFEEILRYIQFSDESKRPNDRLAKVHDLVCVLNKNFKNYCSPGEDIIIDETMIPFRGRLKFRQYLLGKSYKYGVQLYKACDPEGYTYSLQLYCDQEEDEEEENSAKIGPKSNQVVLKLLESYLNEGRTLVSDNFYTNIELAEELLSSKTHLVGTMRKAVKNVPKFVLEPTLKKGGVIGQESDKGIVVATWKDKKDVHFMTTKHTIEIISTGEKNRKGEDIYRPAAIIYYNERKQFVDLSDQLSSFFSPLRKTIRWFHKVAFMLLLGTAVVNSWIVYKKLTGSRIQISSFRDALIDDLIETPPVTTPSSRHKLQKTDQKDKNNHSVRRRCIVCYAKLSKELGRKEALKKCPMTVTRCVTCVRQPYMCLDCFDAHSDIPL